jgi:hypothetical protein
MAHPPRIPVWLRWDQLVIYFVTICVANRKPILANREAFNAFKLAASKLEDWHVLAAILMPDHVHVLVAPTKERETKLGNFSAVFRKIQFVQDLCQGRKIGRMYMNLTKEPASGALALQFLVNRERI